MGFLDAISKEDRVEVTFTDFYNLMRESAKAELMENALRHDVPAQYILAMLDAAPADEEEPVDEEDPAEKIPVEVIPAEDGEIKKAVADIFGVPLDEDEKE